MYVLTGEKSYLWTDYCPTRKYLFVKFTDGNGKQCWKIAYRWGWWTCYLKRLCEHCGGGVTGSPMAFDSIDEAKWHLKIEREWPERETRSKQVSVEIVGDA
jgi:hypothetical protein